MDAPRLIPCLTPHGRLLLAPSDEGPALEPALAERIRQAFAREAGHGLLRLGPPSWGVTRGTVARWIELTLLKAPKSCLRHPGESK